MGKLRIQFEAHEDMLEAHWSGQYDARDAVKGFADLLMLCRASGRDRILIDLSKLEGGLAAVQKILYALSTLELYDAYKAGGGHALRMAYYGVSPQVMESYKPGEELAKRHGVTARVFTEAGQARTWLHAPGAPRVGVRTSTT